MIMKLSLSKSGIVSAEKFWKRILETSAMISVKKNLTTLGPVTINNNHPFSKGKNGFQISPRLQELMVYSAQLDSYENCNEVLEKYIDIKVSASQVWRVANVYGEEAGKTISEEIVLTPCKKEEVIYGMADGSMIFTREEGWKEVKVGRIFKSSSCIHAGDKPGWISNSQYLVYLSDHKKFTAEMEKPLDYYSQNKQRIVFISDGAPWIKNWIADAYPDAISVLDYYHASEHLHDYAKVTIKDDAQRKQWLDKRLGLLLNGEVQKIIDELNGLPQISQEARQLIDYYESNKTRMNYPQYKKIGAGIIGSGAIESAHRTVVQKRMKQSGQRWGRRGAQNMLNLRVTKKNNRWSKIVELVKEDFFREAA